MNADDEPSSGPPDGLPDELLRAWRDDAAQPRVTIDAALLRQQVERQGRDFDAMIRRRDASEILVGAVLLVSWFATPRFLELPWTWWLGVPTLVWTIGFFVVDGMRRRRRGTPPADAPLADTLRASLDEVEHQIGLLRNVFWWYLLPTAVSSTTFISHVMLDVGQQAMAPLAANLGIAAFTTTMLCGVFAGVDHVNQQAIRNDLRPRRRELLGLLDALSESETGDAGVGGTDAGAELADAARPGERPGVVRRWLVFGLIHLACMTAWRVGFGPPSPEDYRGAPQAAGRDADWLAERVVAQRDERSLVALAARVTQRGDVVAEAAHGERALGSGVAVALTDRWHVGGITKAVTATMLARLIERGVLDWETTVGTHFPEERVDPAWRPATLAQLMTDTAGVPRNLPREWLRVRDAGARSWTEVRREAMLDVLSGPPEAPPGERHRYSNVGYAIAAAMAERATGVSWRRLVEREVFEPLGIIDFGFGPPRSDTAFPQPRGHRARSGRKRTVDDQSDNTPIIGPSGRLHLSLAGLCRFAEDHLRGPAGRGELLEAATYRRLQTPALRRYACGWEVRRPVGQNPCRMLWHNGSNTEWYALVAIAPELDLVVAVASNDGDDAAAEAAAFGLLDEYAARLMPDKAPPAEGDDPFALPVDEDDAKQEPSADDEQPARP